MEVARDKERAKEKLRKNVQIGMYVFFFIYSCLYAFFVGPYMRHNMPLKIVVFIITMTVVFFVRRLRNRIYNHYAKKIDNL